MKAEMCGANTIPIRDDHPIESLRGKVVLKFAVDPADLPRPLRLSTTWALTPPDSEAA